MANQPLPANKRIDQDPKIMVGKPVIRGTRIRVERIIAHLATNPSLDDLFAAYPELTIEDVKAALAISSQGRPTGARVINQSGSRFPTP